MLSTQCNQTVAEKTVEKSGKGGARPGAGAPKGNQNRTVHGLTALRRAWSRLGHRVIDGRSPAAIALRKWRAGIVADLGGKEAISTQQATLIDLTVRTKFLLDSVDAWLLTQETLVNKRNRSLFPVVMQRQALADALGRYLAQLGLERKVKALTLGDMRAELLARQKDQP